MSIHVLPRHSRRGFAARRWHLTVAVCALISTAMFGVALVSPADAAVMEQTSWQVSNNQTSVTGVTYTYEATVMSSAVISRVTIVLPSSPVTSPVLGPIFGLGAGNLSVTDNMLIYTVQKPTLVAAGTRLYLQFTALTNTDRQGWFSSIFTTLDNARTPAIVDAGETTSVAFLTRNSAPDSVAFRTVAVAVHGTALTIASPLQGYTVQNDTELDNTVRDDPDPSAGTGRLAVAVTTQSLSGARTTTESRVTATSITMTAIRPQKPVTLEPVAVPVVWAPAGTGVRFDTVAFAVARATPKNVAPKNAVSDAPTHVLVIPAY